MIAAADHGDEDLVTVAHMTQMSTGSPFAARRIQFERALADNIGRNNLINQIVNAGAPKFGQHFLDVRIGGPDMSADKVAMHLKLSQCCTVLRHRSCSS